MAEKGEQMVQSSDDILSVRFTQFSSPTPKTNKHQLKNLFKPMNVFNKNDFLSGDL